jgi:preprotein translocase subunit SecE
MISLGSLAEVKFYLKFSESRIYISKEDFIFISELSEEVGKMVWTSKEKLKNKLYKE